MINALRVQRNLSYPNHFKPPSVQKTEKSITPIPINRTTNTLIGHYKIRWILFQQLIENYWYRIIGPEHHKKCLHTVTTLIEHTVVDKIL